MERQVSNLETGLLRKNLSIRRVHNDDVFLDAGLSRRAPTPREAKKLLSDDASLESGISQRAPTPRGPKKLLNDDVECRVTGSVLLSTFVTVSGSFCTGCGVGYSSAAQSGITKELSLSVAEYSMFGSILTFGGMIGAIFSGKIADVLGRKRAMLFAEIFCGAGWLAIALAQDAMWLDCGRLLLGVGVGLFSYVIPIYIAEISPKHVRGSFVFANQLMQNCGISLFFIVGNFIPWRILSIIGMVPCVIHVFGLFFIPESPRWLAKFGRDKECRIALQRLRGHDADISYEANAIKDSVESSLQGGGSRMTDLFQKRYAYPMLIGVGLMLFQQLSGSSGVTYYASSLFQRGGFPSAIGTTVLAIIMIPKAMMGTILVEKMGRRALLMGSCAGMCLFALLLSVSFCFQSLGVLEELTPIFTCIGVLGHIVTFAMGMGGLPWIIMSEIFPMNVKVSAGTLVTLTNWSFGWIITYAFNFLMQWNAAGTFLVFSTVSAASIVFVYMLVPETKGKTLEEIQASFSNFLR
ncbi:PREDICTED: sugar transporter ERD6 [Tarenaya hassleriana]|uniref:sugar transporter ERD6 n=1 Tax=Tarenaya hassleriana TaxID=28532 RepID=UPI00053C7D65|nr:PREDICTED: sugar transporter ERD6 [Tarenaya hassleriana]